jgi:CheY-like chemotaxis protein
MPASAIDPRVDPTLAADPRMHVPRPALPGRLRVLLVEDDEADAYLIEQVLVDNPRVKEVVVAGNGVEALELVEHGGVAPDLAFVDLNMPRKDGYALLTHFAMRRGPWFPAIVLTSSRLRADELRSRARGAFGFVTKPISQAKLREALNRAIAKV